MKRNLFATLALALAGCLIEAINSPAAVHYVDANGANATPPYTNWVTAATNIQDAVSVASAGDMVLVTDGVYHAMTVTNPMVLLSVNGPLVTVIKGGHVTLADGASLTGFTVTMNSNFPGNGGGVWCESTNAFLTNCVISSNSCVGHWLVDTQQGIYICIPGAGGGVYRGTLYNCILTGNSANLGGGASGSILYNCTLSGNRVTNSYSPGPGVQHVYYGKGCGAAESILRNSIVYSNWEVNNYYDSVLNYCCTTPFPTNGVGNITNAPLFVDYDNDNLHLQTNSPGINAGNNDYVTTTIDLDGNPRIAGGRVDMGAYEFQPCLTGGQFCDAACSPVAGFSFTFSGAIVGQHYRIQTSPNLAAGSWTDLTNFIYTGPFIITDPSVGAGPKRFYRAVTP